MTGLKTYFKEREKRFDSAYAPPPRRVSSLNIVLVSATAFIVVLGISTIAIQNYSRNARLSALNAEQLASIVLDEGERINLPYDRFQMDQTDASASSRPTITEINDSTNQQSQSPSSRADQITNNVTRNYTFSPKPILKEQETIQEPTYLDTRIVAASQQPVNRNFADPLSVSELAAIAPENGLALPEEILVEDSTLFPVPNPAKNQAAVANDTAWRIQVMSLNRQTDAEEVWTRLQRANRDLLDNLSLHIQSARLSKGTFYRVQAGPLVDGVAAASLCQSLKSRNQDCLIVPPR